MSLETCRCRKRLFVLVKLANIYVIISQLKRVKSIIIIVHLFGVGDIFVNDKCESFKLVKILRIVIPREIEFHINPLKVRVLVGTRRITIGNGAISMFILCGIWTILFYKIEKFKFQLMRRSIHKCTGKWINV